MGNEVISVTVGGSRYTAWESADVSASAKDAARTFTLKVAAETGPEATKSVFAAGAAVQVYSNQDLLLTGYVDRYQPKLGAHEAAITITGRSKTADLIDSSAKHATGRFKGKKPSEIASELAKAHGVSVQGHSDEVPINYQLTQGMSIFDTIEELVRQQGFTLAGQADGSLKVANAKGAKKHRGALLEGRNILEGSSDHNWSNRHSEYIVKGQTPIGHGPDALQIEQIVRDAGVNRHRPVIVIERNDTTKALAKSRAKNRRDKAAGNSLSATVKVQGFRDEAGEIWTPGHLVWMESRFLGVAQDMFIETVNYSQDESGSIATLSLVDPRAHGGKKGKGAKSDATWDQGGDND